MTYQGREPARLFIGEIRFVQVQVDARPGELEDQRPSSVRGSLAHELLDLEGPDMAHLLSVGPADNQWLGGHPELQATDRSTGAREWKAVVPGRLAKGRDDSHVRPIPGHIRDTLARWNRDVKVPTFHRRPDANRLDKGAQPRIRGPGVHRCLWLRGLLSAGRQSTEACGGEHRSEKATCAKFEGHGELLVSCAKSTRVAT